MSDDTKQDDGAKVVQAFVSDFALWLEADMKRWICECGESPDITSDKWRYNGTAWEHHHGYPIGHVEAKLKHP